MKPTIESRLPLLGGIVAADPMNEDELVAIESELGVSLPEDYRVFVQAFGAASFGGYVQVRPKEEQPIHAVKSLLGTPIARYERVPFSHFYGSNTGNQSLAEAIEAFKGRMPETMIPIGDDGSGNQICLGVKDQQRGKVYYWDHHNEWDEEDYLQDYGEPMPPEVKFQNVYLVAESFEDFIKRLEVLEDS